MEIMGTTRETTLFVGDQLFTDVWGAKRAGIHNILVRPIHPKEEIQIVLKRYLEKVVLHFYTKKKKKTAKSRQVKKRLKNRELYYRMYRVER